MRGERRAEDGDFPMLLALVRYAVKHAVAAVVYFCAMVALAVVTYFGLFAWAILTNQGLGGPLALPMMVLVAMAFAAVAAIAVLWPVTTLTEAICRALRWHVLAQIPVSTALMLAQLFLLGPFVASRFDPLTDGVVVAIVAALLLISLGIYWWTLQGTDWLIGLGVGFIRRLRARRGSVAG